VAPRPRLEEALILAGVQFKNQILSALAQVTTNAQMI